MWVCYVWIKTQLVLFISDKSDLDSLYNNYFLIHKNRTPRLCLEKPDVTRTVTVSNLCQVDLKWTIRKKWMEMTKKKPHGHNIGGSSKQKRRKENKGKSQI